MFQYDSINKFFRRSLSVLGISGNIYVGLVICLYLVLIYVTYSTNSDIKSFVALSESIGGIEFLKANETKQHLIIGIGGFILFITVFSQIILSNALSDELTIFRNVLAKSSKTNMLINPNVFSLPQLKDLAKSYNDYVHNKMHDYSELTEKMIQIDELLSNAKETKLKNERLFDGIPLPVYAIYRDNHHTIAYSNFCFKDLIGTEYTASNAMDSEIGTLGGDISELNSIMTNTVSAIEYQKGTISYEKRTYSGVQKLYEVYREPVIDAQGICIMVVTVLIERTNNEV